MTELATETRTVVVERTLSQPPEKVWRALTTPHLMAEWLMSNDFEPTVGHRFKFTADWGSVDCEVLDVEPARSLSYKWDAMGLESVVTWTLTPTTGGTALKMEQTGFRPDQEQAYRGAQFGWARFLDNLEGVLAKTN